MDSYSGRQPRLFISFRLDNESNGQPLQLNTESEERMDTSESYITASSHIASPPLKCDPQPGQEEIGTRIDLPTVMDSAVSPHAQGEESSIQEVIQNDLPLTLPVGLHDPAATPQSMIRHANVESSSTDESCGAYIARKWEQLGASPENGTQGPSGGNIERASESAALELAPTQNPLEQVESETNSVSSVAFLDSTSNQIKSKLKSMYRPPEPKIQKLCVKIGDTRREFSVSASEAEGLSNAEGGSATGDEFELDCPHAIVPHASSNRSASDTGQESAGPVGSTVADAIYAPVGTSRHRVGDTGSVTSVDFPEEITRSPQLSASSRVLIKECFDKVSPVNLPAGHTTLALNESQVNCIVKAVADEAVKTSLKMMESLVERASILSLRTSQLSHGGRVTANKSGYRAPTPRPQSGMTSGDASDTSGALRSSDDFDSIGYAYEHSDLESQPFATPPIVPPGCSRVDPGSAEAEFQVDSPGAQTLAVLIAEAAAEKSKASFRKRPRKKTTSNSSVNRHRVPRACKIMKEAYFKGMEWTKIFVSGPVDPRWNPYKFYCQICKGNISIYGCGAREILRHHATERHLRKDQRWRYEHLATEDPVTKMVKHYVRGKDGKLLTPYELQLELPKFFDVPLVDIGEKLPFFEDYLRGTDYMTSSSENRTRVQVSVLGHYLRTHGDISALRNL